MSSSEESAEEEIINNDTEESEDEDDFLTTLKETSDHLKVIRIEFKTFEPTKKILRKINRRMDGALMLVEEIRSLMAK